MDNNIVEKGREDLKKILADWNQNDIYNADETGIYYCMMPNKTLSKEKNAKGSKKDQKD